MKDPHILFRKEIASGSPTPEDGCSCNAIDAEGEGSHSEIAIVGLAHFFHIIEPSGHVSPQLIVHLFLIPHETLNVLQNAQKTRKRPSDSI